MYRIVTNDKIINQFKKSRFFKVNLGLVNTIEKNGDRTYNERDKFMYFYNNQYKTTIYGKGHIGDIFFYLDYYIKSDVMAVYHETEEFIFDYEEEKMKQKGPEFYLGWILKELEKKNEERIKENEEKKIERETVVGNPDKVFINPGAVSYADIQAYIQKKNEERMKILKENAPNRQS